MRESYIREIQVKQIDLEQRKKTLQESEVELRKQARVLEKRKELLE